MRNQDKYNIQNVGEYFEQFGCQLKSLEYKGVDSPLEFVCSCGRTGIMTLRSFKRSKYHKCQNCLREMASERIKKNINNVRKDYEKYGCKLLEDVYISNDTPMKFLCKCGNEDVKTYSGFIKTGQCKVCNRKNSSIIRGYNYNFVDSYFKQHGCVLLEKEYISCKRKLKYLAKCGHIDYVTLDSFMSNKYFVCQDCAKQLNSGKNNYNWKGGTYNSESEAFRKSYEFKQWQIGVFKRDNYICQCCNKKKSGELNSHHLDGYNWCIEKRTDINNGVTLCGDCHIDFHQKYGYGNNTKEQFEEWLDACQTIAILTDDKVEMIKDVQL
jgi:hypothetical protein